MIIHDFLDNDLYKFTAMNAIQKKFPDSEVVYRFVNRGNTSFPPGFADALKRWRLWREWYFQRKTRSLCEQNVIILIRCFSIF